MPLRGEWEQRFARWHKEVLEHEEKLQDVIRSYPSAPLLSWCPHCNKDSGIQSLRTARESNGISHGNHRLPLLNAAFDFIAQLGSGALSKVRRRSWKRCRTKKSGEPSDEMSSLQELDGTAYLPELQDSKLTVIERGFEEMILELDPHAAELPTYPYPAFEMSECENLVELPIEVGHPLVHDETSVSNFIPTLQKGTKTLSVLLLLN